MQRDLVERAMAGDHGAFADLARASIGRLFSTARLILRDDGRAEDATQEALIAAWRDLSALRDPDRFEAWLHRLLVRVCYREARRGQRRWTVESDVRLVLSPTPDPANDLSDRDRLERGFRRLGADERIVLVLHYYLGLTLEEVAAVLGVPSGTVRSRLHRARHAMRAALEADDRSPFLPERRLV
jgi:RNA polymerase sigma-70 factor (ECF subfamily)